MADGEKSLCPELVAKVDLIWSKEPSGSYPSFRPQGETRASAPPQAMIYFTVSVKFSGVSDTCR